MNKKQVKIGMTLAFLFLLVFGSAVMLDRVGDPKLVQMKQGYETDNWVARGEITLEETLPRCILFWVGCSILMLAFWKWDIWEKVLQS